MRTFTSKLNVWTPRPRIRAPLALRWEKAPIPFQLATYRETMRRIDQGLSEAFGPCRTFISEPRRLPFPLVEQAG